MNTLTAQHRCDRCGAQAYVQMDKGSATLLFCAHHFNEHGIALGSQGWTTTIDQVASLLAHA